jgi:hypothetical protein
MDEAQLGLSAPSHDGHDPIAHSKSTDVWANLDDLAG